MNKICRIASICGIAFEGNRNICSDEFVYMIREDGEREVFSPFLSEADAVLAAELFGLFDIFNVPGDGYCDLDFDSSDQLWKVTYQPEDTVIGCGTFCEAICNAILNLSANRPKT